MKQLRKLLWLTQLGISLVTPAEKETKGEKPIAYKDHE